MDIKTRYEIGEHIWVIYENQGEVCLYDDYIAEIVMSKKGLIYLTSEAIEEVEENMIVLYEDESKLKIMVQKLMKEIREKEKKVENRK